MSDARLHVLLDEPPIGTVSPLVHGHFVEHLGRCVQDGLWVGHDSTIPNEGGFRTDVLNALAKIGVPQLRWPGGCFADTYHWRDGIGPRENRPRTLGESCGLRVIEDNHLGTHEFIALCRRVGAEPYLAGNVGSGSPQEMMDWVQYCNGTLDTTLVRERAANGHLEPLNVVYWGVGNENWGCGGHYDAADYAKEFRRYATFLRRAHPGLQLIACGDNAANPDWNRELVGVLRNHLWLIDHLAIHRYWGAGHATEFTIEEYYHLLRGPHQVEQDIRQAHALLSGVAMGRRKIGICYDEWAVWHPQARADNNYEAPSTMRDALAAAATLDVFHAHADCVTMANLAQIANILQCLVQTDGAAMWTTPTYHVFDLYAPHRSGASVPVRLAPDVPVHTSPAVQKSFPEASFPAGTVALVSASATRQNETVTVSVSNRHHAEPLTVHVTLRGASVTETTARLLSADAPKAVNGKEAPNAVTVVPFSATQIGDGFIVTLPPCSVATVQVQVS